MLSYIHFLFIFKKETNKILLKGNKRKPHEPGKPGKKKSVGLKKMLQRFVACDELMFNLRK